MNRIVPEISHEQIKGVVTTIADIISEMISALKIEDWSAESGQRLRARRKQLGLPSRQLSFQGCSPQYISRFERAERRPSLRLLLLLCILLDIHPEYVLTGHGKVCLNRKEVKNFLKLCNIRGETARRVLTGWLELRQELIASGIRLPTSQPAINNGANGP